MNIDEDQLELLERRLAESVENRVRSRLFAIYGTIGAGILAAFTFFGFNLISSVEPTLTKAAIEGAEEAIQPFVQKANKAAEEASALALRSKAELDAMERFRRDAQVKLNATLGKVDEATISIEDTFRKISDDLDSAEKDVDTYRQRSTDLFLSVNYEDTIKQIAKNLDELTAAVASLRTESSSDALQKISNVDTQSPYDALVEQSIEFPIDLRTTVYFQFTGVARELAEEISRKLDDDNFIVPGEERIGAAAGKSEVRYFFPEDQLQAELFAKNTNKVLGSMGYRATVSDRFVQLAKGSPRKGVLELWLEPRLD